MNFFASHFRAMLLFFAVVICPFTYVAAQRSIPELWGQRVHDETKSLSAPTVDYLERRLKLYEDSTSTQIAILIIPSLNGEPIEDYSIKVVEKWKLGTSKNDNGVLLLVAVDDHKMRIEAGQGLEDRLTDARCSEIIRDKIAPNFRRGDYDAGIRDGVADIIKTIAGEYTATPASTGSSTSMLEKIFDGIVIFGLLFLFAYGALFAKGCASWVVYVFLLPFYAFGLWFLIGSIGSMILLGVYAIGFPLAKTLLPRTKWGKSKIKKLDAASQNSKGSYSSRGSLWGVASILGGVGGFLGGGSMFSGRGGGFGGGGASGSW